MCYVNSQMTSYSLNNNNYYRNNNASLYFSVLRKHANGQLQTGVQDKNKTNESNQSNNKQIITK
jgi:hypothetical protein